MKLVRIEIHGLSPGRAKEVREKIFGFSNWGEVIVTTVHDITVDRAGAHRPFLQIISDEDAHALEPSLATLNLPMEFPPLLRKYKPVKSIK